MLQFNHSLKIINNTLLDTGNANPKKWICQFWSRTHVHNYSLTFWRYCIESLFIGKEAKYHNEYSKLSVVLHSKVVLMEHCAICRKQAAGIKCYVYCAKWSNSVKERDMCSSV